MKLKDKIILVTGGSGLLGRSIQQHITLEGGIAVNIDINIESCLPQQLCCDVTDLEQIVDIIDRSHKYFGKIDGLVNNAYPRTEDWGKYQFDEMPIESWRQNVEIQMNSYVNFCQQIIKKMLPQKFGNIVNIASIYGVVGNDFTLYEGTEIISPAPYAAIKGGIINLSRYLASYYGKNNIRVNCISPGGIFNHQNPIFVSNYEKKVPMKRMGTPMDIAPAVSFLLSDEASYITGQNLIIDGGWTCI